MSIERAQRDTNRATANLGVTNDANLELREFRLDPTTNRLLVTASLSGVVTTTPVTFQYKVTASAVQLASNTLTNGCIITAKSTNSGNVFIGVSAAVTTTADGTGTGTILEAGGSLSWAADNTNRFWVIGTAADVISISGS